MSKWINLLGICGGIFAFIHFVLGGMVGNTPAQAQQTQIVKQATNGGGLRDPRTLVRQREKSRSERVIENYEATARMIDEAKAGIIEEYEAKKAHQEEVLRSMRGY